MQHTDPYATPRGADSTDYPVANDPRPPATAAPARAPRLPGLAGWDPFEIWRTRVRDARRDAPSLPRA